MDALSHQSTRSLVAGLLAPSCNQFENPSNVALSFRFNLQRGSFMQVPLLIVSLAAATTAACGSANGSKSPDTQASADVPRASPPTDSVRWQAVDQALGRKGEMQPGEAYKYAMPRSDLQVTSGGVQIKPALSLGSWVAFKAKASGAVAMGDLVLTEKEYNRVIGRLQQGGVALTAVHKHLPEQSPAIWWTHIHAEGDPVKIAETIKAALALTSTPAGAPNASV